MKYLLDTDHISFLQRRSNSEFIRLTLRMSQHSLSDFALSVISFHEQVIGAHSFINRAQTNTDIACGYTLLLETLNSFAKAPVLPFDAKAIAIFDEMRSQKVRVSTMDLRIAAIAISNNLVLLTRNTGDFSKIPRLITEDWTV
ncbi:MAG: type II toxin-antitoxin system VapC family toxin [Microcystis aeruginosa Ma_MB_S_20031200_S102]|uniref:Type II toxin-antitoxin system VapC family toxin n=1 Tax=Microcystis aeruginosa Ma_MB_S_20031200_S102 TaxID=2486254 RepID=A0A552F2Z2_MICAE|nr:MAG: type II toxin-antitoxin system VapC family toxin [Microcystis aeruginosa Ma_MB_S_20031200_S102D]TRU41067.1 MAG: type II toxin-antitoxin system VapC family toxin [Microcystis aeruginosa Ma_MB_S_20031200_S102]